MENMKDLLEGIKTVKNREEQIQILQEINQLLLTQYTLVIDDDFVIHPIEIEAYYSGYGFEDDTVHGNELQKNRFGKFYFHRKGQAADNKILFTRSGIDICLSDSNEYTFGVLIRSARINQENTIIAGPQLLAQRVYKHICKNAELSTLSDEDDSILVNFERNSNVLTKSAPRTTPLIIHSSRIGLNAESKYALLNLRSLSDLSISKQKEKDVLEYMKYNKIEPIAENVKELLGYNSNSILEQLKAKG